jgi:thymidylate synthase
VELLGASFTLSDPADSLPAGTGRGVVKALAATEALQLIGGFHDPDALVAAAPHFAAFLDPATGAQRSPYGPRIADQVLYAIGALTEDPDSRRAQMVIWHPQMDARHGLHDYPCTTSLQLLLRDGRLHMQVHMRSNDFWLGVPYDVFMFTQLQLAVASVLGAEPGAYRHSAASLHIYEKHLDQADALHAPTGKALPTFGITASTWGSARARAATIHEGELPDEPTAGERWLHMAMASVHG